MNLYRQVKGMGFTPLLCGNVKGFLNKHSTPEAMAPYANKWGQKRTMINSFADGTKVAIEQALIANATDMSILQRGMRGLTFHGHVDEFKDQFDVEELQAVGGAVEYVIGAQPSPGVFVYAINDDPKQHSYLDYYKMGLGPLYSFYTPYHLCHFEVPNSVVRVVDFGDQILNWDGAPTVEVIAVAKKVLQPGDVLEGIGGSHVYGLCEKATTTSQENLLPIGLVEGCTVKKPVTQDQALTFNDVDFPTGRLCDWLYQEQCQGG